jgi:hypothetical protein
MILKILKFLLREPKCEACGDRPATSRGDELLLCQMCHIIRDELRRDIDIFGKK